MKMRKILYVLSVLACIAGMSSCEKSGDSVDVSGEWHLTDTGGLITGNGLRIDVYASFSGGNFELYQRIGESQARYWSYSGTYTLSGNVLTGRYSDGTRLGGSSGEGYTVDISKGTMTLTSVFSGEVSVYESCTIPSEVRAEAVTPVKSADSTAPAPVL